MDNQHKMIKGYRDLSAEDIALMNEIKAKGEELAALLDKAHRHVVAQYDATLASHGPSETPFEEGPLLDTPETAKAKHEERHRLDKAQPFRWHSIANTHLQEGIMALVRSVAQPSSF